MKKKFLFFVFATFLTSCGVSTTPYPTYTPMPTQTPYPTYTPQVIAAATFIPTNTPLPDTQVIIAEPQSFLINKLDLPKEGQYFTPDGWEKAFNNSEIVARSGIAKGEQFIAETERVRGWRKNFVKGSYGAPLPDQIIQYIMQFRTKDGAKIAFDDKENDMYLNPEINLVEKDVSLSNIGDEAKGYYIERFYRGAASFDPESTTAKQCLIVVRVLHRNMVIETVLFHEPPLDACATSMKPELGLDISRKILDKMEQAELVDSWQE
jgi:hypothetical protein